MEYFGRNLFVMNILQAITTRKPLKTKELWPGNGGGYPPRNEGGERGRELESSEIEAFLTSLSSLNETIASFARTTGGTPEKPRNP
jgi:hypothetical protein